ncbi:MAG: hypothetical protein U1E62_03515 [Alsobacter sp.]
MLAVAPASAQGIVKGAKEGAKVGSEAAGPVGGAVGGAVGGVAGGVAGGVKGVLGLPQNTATASSRKPRTTSLTRTSLRAALIGKPLTWKSDDGARTGTTVYYTDGTAALSGSNLPAGADDSGQWTMKGNRLCVTWDKTDPGQETCSTWTKTGPRTFRSSDGITAESRA